MTAVLAPVLSLPRPRPAVDALERAWRELPQWEDAVTDSLGHGVASELLALWALSRIGPVGEESLAILPELTQEDGLARLGGPMLRDLVQVAFSLGAAWGARRECSR